MLTPAQVRSAWPIVTDATDAQLTVALANAQTVVATDLSAEQYDDALGAVAAHFARLRLEAGGSVPSSSAGKVRSASFANCCSSLSCARKALASELRSPRVFSRPRSRVESTGSSSLRLRARAGVCARAACCRG